MSKSIKSLLVWNIAIWCTYLFLHFLFSLDASTVEVIYFENFYQIIRCIYDYSIGLFPIPMIYIAFLLLIFILIKVIKKIRYTFSCYINGWQHALLYISGFIGSLLLIFYLSWGYNYKRPSFEDNYDLPHIEIDSNAVYKEILLINGHLIQYRREFIADSLSIHESTVPQDLETTIRESMIHIVEGFGSPANGRGRVRKLYPAGILLRISTAGIYMPYAMEGQIDAGLHPLQQPFVMAHEMGHVYGYAEEGTCNFLGLLTCIDNDSPFIQYSGLLGYWRYLASNLRRTAPQKYLAARNDLAAPIKSDLKDIAVQMDKYPDILPAVRDKVYHTYLQSNGIKDGLSNYSMIVQLVARWKASNYHRSIYKKIYKS